MFNVRQQEIIQKGLDRGWDVSIYSDENLDPGQKHQIYLGCESGVDVRVYADCSLSERRMVLIRMLLESKYDVSNIDIKTIKPKINLKKISFCIC